MESHLSVPGDGCRYALHSNRRYSVWRSFASCVVCGDCKLALPVRAAAESCLVAFRIYFRSQKPVEFFVDAFLVAEGQPGDHKISNRSFLGVPVAGSIRAVHNVTQQGEVCTGNA